MMNSARHSQWGSTCARATVGLLFIFGCAESAMAAVDPFANSQVALPPGYVGPSFSLSHNYPKSISTPVVMPWQATLKGLPISKNTAPAYAMALKEAVSADINVLVNDYPNWNAEQRGWFNQPWLSASRDPIHGMFSATVTDASLFNDPALKVKQVPNFAAVYYNATAAVTLGKFWGATAMKPNLITNAAQFPEGSLIVKLAFTQVRADEWPVMSGSPSWSIYKQWVDQTTGAPAAASTLFNVQLMQIDIIVKDSQAAPKTGWVFSTLVYDNRIQGDTWRRMVPLGAMWGNDPTVKSSVQPGLRAALEETWINDDAPAYSLATLGWGGRLSGPNDQAVQGPGSYFNAGSKTPGTVPVANSSCMSCHSPAQWQNKSFLMPGVLTAQGNYIMATPGSAQWMRWFQNRPGTKAMDRGAVALDYDMMFSFKALKSWAKATGAPVGNEKLFLRPSDRLLLQQQIGTPVEQGYNGLPLKSSKP